MMIPQSLAQIVKGIENEPNINQYDSIRVIRQQILIWADLYPIVKEVIEGKTTFTKQYYQIFGDYNPSAASDFRDKPYSHKQEIADLVACIGEFPLRANNPLRLIFDPALSIFEYTLMGFSLPHIFFPEGKDRFSYDRREFLAILLGTLSSASYGVVSHNLPKITYTEKLQHLTSMKENALYLDKIYLKIRQVNV